VGSGPKLIGNILWLVLVGFWMALGYVVAGLIQFVFIITIPFGIANSKLAGLALAPFGKDIVPCDVRLPPSTTPVHAPPPQLDREPIRQWRPPLDRAARRLSWLGAVPRSGCRERRRVAGRR
jgi:hypothetical protein